MVPKDATVECLDCGGTLYQRGGPERARHFYHPPSLDHEACLRQADHPGESDTHARCVALAVDALTDAFANQYDTCRPEVPIDVSRTASGSDRRRADVLLEFSSENPEFGHGIIVEVQHKHHTKDREATTHDYLSAGYSVAWLDASEFAPDHLDYTVVDDKFTDSNAPGYTVQDHNPYEFETQGRDAFDWEIATRGCWCYQDSGEHAWFRVPEYVHPQGREYEACRFCDARRQYDSSLTRYIYDYDGVLAPEFDTEVLRNSYVPIPGEGPSFNEWVDGEARYSDLTVFEEAVAHDSFEPCRGDLPFHVWGYNRWHSTEKGDLLECENCPVNLLVKARRERYILFGNFPDPQWDLLYLKANPRRCSHFSHQGGAPPVMETCPECHGPL